jgi:dTDP-glucose 4,6-dehydratase
MALSYYRSFDLPVTVIRPFNTYGPRQSLRAVIPTIISQVLYGDGSVSLGALHPTRDLSFVTDTAAAFMATLTSSSTIGETINIGTGYEISIGELVSVIARLMGRDVTIREDSQRNRPPKSEVERLLADASKAKNLMDWTPKYFGPEGLERGLLETISWFKGHDGSKSKWKKYQV